MIHHSGFCTEPLCLMHPISVLPAPLGLLQGWPPCFGAVRTSREFPSGKALGDCRSLVGHCLFSKHIRTSTAWNHATISTWGSVPFRKNRPEKSKAAKDQRNLSHATTFNVHTWIPGESHLTKLQGSKCWAVRLRSLWPPPHSLEHWVLRLEVKSLTVTSVTARGHFFRFSLSLALSEWDGRLYQYGLIDNHNALEHFSCW